MDILIKLEVEDWYRFQSYLEKKVINRPRSGAASSWFNVGFGALVGFFFMYIFRSEGGFHWLTASLVSAVFVFLFVLFIYNVNRMKKAYAPSKSGVFVGEHHSIFDGEGIKSKGNGYEAMHAWSVVQQIERKNGMILIFLDTAYAYVFPENKVKDPDALYSYINEQYKKI